MSLVVVNKNCSTCFNFSKRAKILLLDEPTNALDEESENRILDILSKIDKSMIIVSHHKSFIEKIVSKKFII